MSRCPLGLALVVLALGLCLPGETQERGPRRRLERDAEHPLVRRVAAARDKARFVGQRTVQLGPGGAARIGTERVWRDGPRVRIETVGEGPNRGQVVVEDGRRRLVYLPHAREIRQQPPREGRLVAALDKFGGRSGPGRRFELLESDGGQVAGRSARLLEARRPDGTPVMRAWVDAEMDVVLKLQAFNPRGEQVTYFEYTRIAFGIDVPASRFELDVPGARFVSPQEDLAELSRETGLRPVRLAEATGFRLESVRKLGPKRREFVMQSYVGPRGRLSLFILRGDVDGGLLRRLSSGRDRAHVWRSDGQTLVLIGPFPLDVLKRLATQVGA